MARQPHPDVFNVPEKERVVSKQERAESQTAGEIVEGFRLRLISGIKGKEFSSYAVTQQPKLKALITAVIT